MNKKWLKTGRRMKAGIMVLILGMMMAGIHTQKAEAVEAGTYLVTVSPSYSDPKTGDIDDPGHNEAIGQGMTERMCSAAGLLEADDSGQMYLTVRYYLSQFIRNVNFEERNGGSYTNLSYKEMQTKAPDESASDISDKYGYTDYRFPINRLESVFRGKAYIEAMGRDVVFFFTASDPVPGKGDFVISAAGKESDNTQEEERVKVQIREPESSVDNDVYKEDAPDSNLEVDEIKGYGNVDDPVTGIPRKPVSSASSKEDSREIQKPVSYHLETPYDLSRVPIQEARELTEPMLKKAAGITTKGIAGNQSVKEWNKNKAVMWMLLSVSAALVVCFGITSLKSRFADKRNEREDPT